MEEVKIIIRKTNFCGMERVIGKIITATKCDKKGTHVMYKVLKEKLVEKGAQEDEFVCHDAYNFREPFDIIEEVKEENS